MSEDIVGRILRKAGKGLRALRTRRVGRAPGFCEKAAEVICRCTNSAETQLRNMLADFCD